MLYIRCTLKSVELALIRLQCFPCAATDIRLGEWRRLVDEKFA